MNPIAKYMRWLHTQWPAGKPEKLPEVNPDGTTAVPGLYVVGDLTGIPLLKFSVDTGTRAVHHIKNDSSFTAGGAGDGVYDVAIIGAGLSGVAAAMEAKRSNLNYIIFEAQQAFATIKDFPKGKPIFTYPTDMTPAGDITLESQVKEPLVAELEAQREAAGIEPVAARIENVQRKGGRFVLQNGDETISARRVIVAIGRSGNFRKLDVPGEEKDKVFKRLHDPREFKGKEVLVVGGGDSALEASLALALAGAKVTHSYRKPDFSRPKPDNIEKLNQLINDPNADVDVENPSAARVTTSFTSAICDQGSREGAICLQLPSQVKEIREHEVVLSTGARGEEETIPNEVVFAMIGREAPLAFFRQSGVPITGEWRTRTWVAFILFSLFCLWMYHWKKGVWLIGGQDNPIHHFFERGDWFPYALTTWFKDSIQDTSSFAYTLITSMKSPSFYYTLAYCSCVGIFGIRRIRRRKTPYVKVQTLTLMAIQVIPLFLLPEIVLPWAGRHGAFERGTTMGAVADQFFEPYDIPDQQALADAGLSSLEQWDRPIGRERAYWRAYGFILAWPLFVFNWFTPHVLWGWVIVGFLQTFVLIPLLIRYWGKGAYCGWICSCGALAETLGDAHRHKMPHGPFWNRVNMTGQVVLLFASVILLLRLAAGVMGDGSAAGKAYHYLLSGLPIFNYKWFVDLMLAGVVGLGAYFWFSGRVWCRFACPLAALMHIYGRFSRFRIFADKKKCISCNVCTSVCHQGIDIMNFANKGAAMEDPECVRCSACVQSCPTGVLSFGRYGKNGEIVYDRLPASLIQVAEVGRPYA